MMFNNNNNSKNNNDLAKNENSMFDPFFGEIFGVPFFKDLSADKMMKTDVEENEKGFDLTVDLPGFKKEQVSLELEDGYLTINAKNESSSNEKDKKGNFIRRERCSSSCKRSFFVGENVTEEDINASLSDGVLKVFIPKKEQIAPEKKKIEIR